MLLPLLMQAGMLGQGAAPSQPRGGMAGGGLGYSVEDYFELRRRELDEIDEEDLGVIIALKGLTDAS